MDGSGSQACEEHCLTFVVCKTSSRLPGSDWPWSKYIKAIAERWGWIEMGFSEICHLVILLPAPDVLAFYAAVDSAVNQSLATHKP